METTVTRGADNKGHEVLSTGHMKARATCDKYLSFVWEPLEQQCVDMTLQ